MENDKVNIKKQPLMTVFMLHFLLFPFIFPYLLFKVFI